jgi:hypothetical protein
MILFIKTGAALMLLLAFFRNGPLPPTWILRRPSFGNSPRYVPGVHPVERVYRVWVEPIRGVGGMDDVVKPTWRYLRRPLTGTA